MAKLKLLFLTRKDFCREDTEGMAEYIGNGCKSIDNKAMTDKDFEGVDLVVRFGCTATVPVKKVLNKAGAIHAVFDKPGFRKILMKHGLCPKTWFSLGDWAYHVDPLMLVEEEGHLPLKRGVKYIGRPNNHYGGKELFVLSNTKHAKDLHDKYGAGNYYISEYIKKVSEFRVHVLQGRVISVEEKIQGNFKRVAWNFLPHKYVRWSQWNEQVVLASIKAMELSGLDFGGVDVITDDNGKAYVLEVNTAPHLPLLDDGTISYHQKCFAKGFKWLSENGREHIPPAKEGVFWSRYIHPAIVGGQ